LRQAREAPRGAGEARGGLVILAACLTDVTEADYDEALSLATAFLAAGACGVVAARWAVPDSATLLLMAAFHHFLNAGPADPAHALRAAQLWMLDPDREIPAAWPDWLGQRARAGLTRAWTWAAFTYQGR
jgi:CHAT domain-containing protein